jgi:Family of unknown function (DUF5906)
VTSDGSSYSDFTAGGKAPTGATGGTGPAPAHGATNDNDPLHHLRVTGSKPVAPPVADLRGLPALEPRTRPEHRRWVVWKYEWVVKKTGEGKWTKIPYQPGGKKAASTRPDEWSTYAEVWRRYLAGGYDGIGMMLLGLQDFGAIDLDKVRDPGTGAFLPWAEGVVRCGSYCEITPSGKGARVLGGWTGGKAHRNGPHREGGGFELFSDCERFITFTGMSSDGARWGNIDETFGGLLAILDRKPNGHDPIGVVDVEIDTETLSAALAELITDGTEDGKDVEQRGPKFMAAVASLRRQGHSFESVFELLLKHPEGVQSKYAGRLKKELERVWKKLNATIAVTFADFRAYMPMHNYIFAPTRETWPAGSVDSRLPKVSIGFDDKGKEEFIPASRWLAQNQPVEQMTWAPGLPMIIEDRFIDEGGWIERWGARCFNLYRPPTIVRGDASEARPWRELLERVYPDDAAHIELWFAQRVQHPEVKINHAMVLGGPPGIGKDTLAEPVKRAVGPWNFREASPQDLLQPFNDFVCSVVLRISEARDLGDFDRFKFYDHMKVYIAAPPDVLRVNKKHVRQYSIFNYCSVIITTNYKTDGIYLPADDRRHYVTWSELHKEDFDDEYWNELWGWYDAGGDRAVAAYLAGLDLTGFDPKAAPPKTPAFWSIVDANSNPENAELADAIDDLGKRDPITHEVTERPKVVTLEMIASRAGPKLSGYLEDSRNARQIPRRLEDCGYVAVRNPGPNDGKWKLQGSRRVIYAKRELSIREQLVAVNEYVKKYNEPVPPF